jgi:hypothetical protein
MYSTIHKNIKKVEFFLKYPKKKRFFHARHETVTLGSSKALQLFVLKLQRFWYHGDLCSIEQKSSNRDDRQTDTQTHRHTQTHTHTPIFLLLYRVQGPQ